MQRQVCHFTGVISGFAGDHIRGFLLGFFLAKPSMRVWVEDIIPDAPCCWLRIAGALKGARLC